MKKYSLFSLFLQIILFSCLSAQIPAPAGLKATVESWQSYSFVRLQWDATVGRPRDIHFNIYKKEITAGDTATFVRMQDRVRMNIFMDKFVAPGKTYSYYITAVSGRDPESAPSDTVTVTLPGSQDPGFISGILTDETTGLPLDSAMVMIIPVRGWKIARAMTQTDGSFMTEAPAGTYALQFVARGYKMEFYDNAQNIRTAARVSVTSGDTARVNASLKAEDIPDYVTLSGTVKDTAGNPVQAKIEIMIFSRESNSRRSFDRRLAHAHTDSLGSYTGRVRTGDVVAVMAIPRDRKYVPEFYNDKKDPAEADKITVTGNLDSINFVLDTRPVLNNGIAGRVLSSSGLGITATVTAYRFKEQGYSRIRKSVVTDSLGNYSLTDLTPGRYILFVLPSEGYLPGFFRYDSTTAIRWKEADSIEVTADSKISDINFYLSPISDSGYARISGVIRDNSGTPVPGAVIYITNENSNISSYAITDQSGGYNMPGLAPGNYSVSGDKIDYQQTTSTVALDYQSGAERTVSFTLSPLTTTAVNGSKPGVPSVFSLQQNYPNPFNPSTTISFTIPEAVRVSLKVYNLIGQEVAQLMNEVRSAGTYTVRFNASHLASGIYLYKLTAGNQVITRKMVLMK